MASQNPAPLTLHGMVHGGQQAVVGATIQLYAAGSTGYGSGATALLTSTVTTGGLGQFSITGDYTCPTPTTQVYILATGGNSGAGDNSALALMAALGDCGNLSSSTFIFINEVTTVASVYALAPFMSTGGGTNLGINGTSNAQGLANAFATVNNLTNTKNGTSASITLPTGATAPATEINTLADIIAPCVNSNGGTGECSTLFGYATPSGGSAPTNTIDAVLDIAQNPANNVTQLYGLVNGTSPFQPFLSPAPNDWTVTMNYSGSGLNNPWGVAVDSLGNLWVANISDNTLSKFSPTGAGTSFTGGGLSLPHYVAIDSADNAWVTNINANSLSGFDKNGTALSGSPFTGGGLSSPYGLAIDGSDNIWIANQGNSSVSKFDKMGNAISGSSGFNGLSEPYFPAIDSSGNVWVADFLGGLYELDSSTGAVTGGPFVGGGLNLPNDLAIDSSGNVWLSNANSPGDISKFDSSGNPVSGPSGYANPGGGSAALLIDGTGNVWVVNPGNNSLSEYSNSGSLLSGSTGYQPVGLNVPESLAIDGSGNIWVSNYVGNSVSEVIGAAAPVITPLSTAASGGHLGERP